MGEKEIQAIISLSNNTIEDFVDSQQKHLEIIRHNLEVQVQNLYDLTAYNIARNESELIQSTAVLYYNSCYYILIPFLPGSGTIATIIAAIITVVKWVIEAVKWLVALIETLHLVDIYNALMLIWPAFRDKMNEFYGKLSELSEKIGWGVDGMMHLVQAVQGGASALAGMTGKGAQWTEARWSLAAIDLGKRVQFNLDQLENDPIAFMFDTFKSENTRDRRDTGIAWDEVNAKISKGLKWGEEAITGIGSVVDELQAIQVGMPSTVAKHIPQKIWDGLDRADSLIYDNLLPGLGKLNEQIAAVNNILDQFRATASDLADRIAHPGDLLADIDNLPEYLRDIQQQKIDDVTNRTFELAALDERNAMAGDIDEYDILHEALSAPTPEPVFMAIEDPARAALMGIFKEPQETWFIGGYKSIY